MLKVIKYTLISNYLDFYEYSCGGRLKSSEIPLDRNKIGSGSDVQSKTEDKLLSMLVEGRKKENLTLVEQKVTIKYLIMLR